MRRRSVRGLRLALAFFLAFWTVGTFAPPSGLADPGGGGLPAEAPILGLRELGANSTVAFYGAQGTETLTIPVPQGLLPVDLTAVVELPVNVQAGMLTVTQDERTISRVPLPLGDRTLVTIPLAGVIVVDNAVTLVLRSYVVPLDGYCLDPTNPLRLTDASLRYEGIETVPSSVADFLPAILRRLTIFIPARPSNVESEAVARLAMAVVARYGMQNTEIVVSPLADGLDDRAEPSAPMERQIVIREGPEVMVGLQGASGVPALYITGPPNQLINQARLLSSDVSRLAVSSRAVVGPLKTVPQLPADVTTIRQLGQPGVNATALNPQVSIGLDQTRLGRSTRNVRVHLRGTHTPLPTSIGGSMVVAIDGETIDQWPVDSVGVIDRWVDVPDRLLQRYTNLGVAINISGNTGRCGEFQPITLTIDGDSPVETTRSDPPSPAGFQSVPQALMPRIEVGIGQDAFADTRRALSILVGLQRMSALPLDAVFMPLQQAVDSLNPAVLISASGWSDPRITLPVSMNEPGELKIAGSDGSAETTLTLDPTERLGSLQTAVDGRRTVLIATSNAAPEQVDELLSWLDAVPGRWSRLTGTAVLAPAGREPVSFGQGDPVPSANSVESHDDLPYLWLGAGIAVLVVAGAGAVWWRTRHETPSG